MRADVSRGLWDAARRLRFRGKHRLLSRWLPAQGRRTARVFDYELELDLSNHVDRLIYLGCYEPANSHRFERLLEPGATVIDVGANIGYFSLLGASRVGAGGRVFAIEPHPLNFAELERTVRRNRLAQVYPLQLGLSDRSGQGEISMPDQEKYPNRTATMLPASGDRAFAVPVCTLDALMAERGIERVDLLKIDVEGYESKIVTGAREAFASGKVRNLIIELNDYWLARSGETRAGLLARLHELGFADTSERWRMSTLLLGPSDDRHFTWLGESAQH